ncbi:uncharacterized protein DS421_13g409180 [Arachis hypogaea]|nr:uncharacterized protein DS421_13g409180 [Arachis hypogaea]
MDQGERAHQQLHSESLLDFSSAQHFSFMALPFNEKARPSNQLELCSKYVDACVLPFHFVEEFQHNYVDE